MANSSSPVPKGKETQFLSNLSRCAISLLMKQIVGSGITGECSFEKQSLRRRKCSLSVKTTSVCAITVVRLHIP